MTRRRRLRPRLLPVIGYSRRWLRSRAASRSRHRFGSRQRRRTRCRLGLRSRPRHRRRPAPLSGGNRRSRSRAARRARRPCGSQPHRHPGSRHCPRRRPRHRRPPACLRPGRSTPCSGRQRWLPTGSSQWRCTRCGSGRPGTAASRPLPRPQARRGVRPRRLTSLRPGAPQERCREAGPAAGAKPRRPYQGEQQPTRVTSPNPAPLDSGQIRDQLLRICNRSRPPSVATRDLR